MEDALCRSPSQNVCVLVNIASGEGKVRGARFLVSEDLPQDETQPSCVRVHFDCPLDIVMTTSPPASAEQRNAFPYQGSGRLSRYPGPVD